MGLFFDSNLSKWKKAVMNAVDKTVSDSPLFAAHDISVSVNTLSGSLTIRGNVYYHPVIYSTRYSQEDAKERFLSRVQGWMNVYADGLGNPPPIKGHFHVIRY